MLHTKWSQTRTHSNHSIAENDLNKNLRRGSMQSINNFSLRRLLGSDPSSHPSNSRSSAETSKSATEVVSKNDGESSSVYSSKETISQPTSSHEKSPEGQDDNQSGDLIFRSAYESKAASPTPAINSESTATVENRSDSLPSPPPTATNVSHRPIVNKTLEPPRHIMGNKLTILRPNALKENQPPSATVSARKVQRRPASSPTSPAPAFHSSMKPVIPDRHSSITPRPGNDLGSEALKTPLYTPGAHSSTKAISTHDIQAIPSPPPPNSSPLSPTNTITPSSAHSLSPRALSSPNGYPFPAFRSLHDSLAAALPIPAPPLTKGHYACYQSHRHMHFSPNVHNPVPCMTCGAEEGRARWKCCWCCLRICEVCMEHLNHVDGRDLAGLMKRIKEGAARVGRVKGPREIMRRGGRIYVVKKKGEEKEEVGGVGGGEVGIPEGERKE